LANQDYPRITITIKYPKKKGHKGREATQQKGEEKNPKELVCKLKEKCSKGKRNLGKGENCGKKVGSGIDCEMSGSQFTQEWSFWDHWEMSKSLPRQRTKRKASSIRNGRRNSQKRENAETSGETTRVVE